MSFQKLLLPLLMVALEKTNLTYIKPHSVIIKNITFLVFNYSNDVYITNLTKKIKLSELEEYLKNI